MGSEERPNPTEEDLELEDNTVLGAEEEAEEEVADQANTVNVN